MLAKQRARIAAQQLALLRRPCRVTKQHRAGRGSAERWLRLSGDGQTVQWAKSASMRDPSSATLHRCVLREGPVEGVLPLPGSTGDAGGGGGGGVEGRWLTLLCKQRSLRVEFAEEEDLCVWREAISSGVGQL
jgi:hypothetical protein